MLRPGVARRAAADGRLIVRFGASLGGLGGPAGQQAQRRLRWRSDFGGVNAERLVRIASRVERLIAEGEFTDNRVVIELGAIGAAEDIVLGPPLAEIRVTDGQLADELGQQRVPRVGSGVEMQAGDDATSGSGPVDVEVARRFVKEHEPDHVALTRGQRVEIGVERAGQTVAGMGVLTYGPLASGWLSGRADPTTGRRASVSSRDFDLAVPANQVKVAAAEQLGKLAAEAGMPMTHMATAFVRAHPAVTSVLIGPRKPEQLADLLAGAEIELGDDVLDRIDEIVAPGTELNPADNYFATPRAIEDKRLRRR
jgi:Aldo/keto reductase family